MKIIIKSVTSDFKKKDENQPIIPDWLFEERSKVFFNYLIALAISTMLTNLSIDLKTLLEVK